MGAAFDKAVTGQAAALGITLTAAATGFVDKGSDFGSDYVHLIKAPRIAVVGGAGTNTDSFGSAWHFFERQIGYPVSVLEASRLGSTPLQNFDLLVLPSGGYGSVWTDRTVQKLKDWIQEGGRVIALENAAELLGEKPDFEWEKKPEPKSARKTAAPTDTLKTYAQREREPLSEEVQGSIYRVTLDASHPLAFGCGGTYFSLLRNNTAYELLKKGWNAGYLKPDAYLAGHVGYKAKAKLQNSAIFGVQELGRGQVVYMAENPLFRAFWHNGKLVFGNAVFMAGQAQ